MSFFTTRERAELGKSAEIRVEGKVRESVRRDFAPRRRPADNDLAGHVGSVMRRVAESSLQEHRRPYRRATGAARRAAQRERARAT